MIASLSNNILVWLGILVFGSVTFSVGQVSKTKDWKVGNNRLVRFILSVWNELFDLLEAIPYLLLITSASVFFLWNFGRTVLNDEIAFALAVGVEWAYIRGVINSHVGKWGLTLTISAFFTSVLWGVLYVAIENGILVDKVVHDALVDGERPFPVQQIFISIAHVLPIAFLSVCSGLMHREIAMAEKAIQDQKAAEEKAEKEREIAEAKERKRLEQERIDALQAEKDRIEIERLKQVALDEAEKRRLEREELEQRAKAAVWAEGEAIKTDSQIRLLQAEAAAKASAKAKIQGSRPSATSDKSKHLEIVRKHFRQEGKVKNVRKLAKDLGVSPNTLYGYIRTVEQELNSIQ